MTNLRVLVTGFEPFGGSSINPSEWVVQRLQNQPPAGIALATAVLPVDGVNGPACLLAQIEAFHPRAVVCLGQAATRPVLTIERVAINLQDYGIPDNSGVSRVDLPVVEGGPAAYFATLPVRRMLERVRAAGVPAELSLSAGAYLCNQVMYTLLHYLSGHSPETMGGFIHLPSLPEQVVQQKPVSASMGIETALRGVSAALQALVAD